MYNRNLPPIKSVERPKKGSLVFGNVKSQEYAKKLENVKNEIIIEVPIKDITDQTPDQAKPKLIIEVPTRNTTKQTPDQTPEETPEQTTDQTPEETPEQTTDQTPEETPDQTPENESIIEEFEDIEKTEDIVPTRIFQDKKKRKRRTQRSKSVEPQKKILLKTKIGPGHTREFFDLNNGIPKPIIPPEELFKPLYIIPP